MNLKPVLMAVGIASAALLPNTASAREGEAGAAARVLSDPAAQLAASATLAAIAETLLDMDIAPIARAIGAMGGGTGGLPPDARLRDLAGPEVDHMPGDIARSVPRAMGSAAEVAGAFDDMMPQFRETARRLRDAIPRY